MYWCRYLYEHKIAIKVGTLNGNSGAAMNDEACLCKGTYVLNVRFGLAGNGNVLDRHQQRHWSLIADVQVLSLVGKEKTLIQC
ncbi:hypothetical protein Tco_0562405 [Tanacetum coccineum]